MILYNVTVNIEDAVHNDWLQWMREVHIPDVMATGLIKEWRMFRILSRQADEAGSTYSIQYYLESLSDYDRYQKEYAPRLQREHSSRYEGRFVAFRTVMEEVKRRK